MSFKVGDKVVCVNAKGLVSCELEEWRVYEIEAIGHMNGVKLIGVESEKWVWSPKGYLTSGFIRADRFRKVQPRRTNAVTKELASKPIIEERVERKKVKI